MRECVLVRLGVLSVVGLDLMIKAVWCEAGCSDVGWLV